MDMLLAARGRVVDLARADPSNRAPGSGEECDEEADGHADSTDEEHSAATSLVSEPETRDSRADVDDVGGDRDQESVVDARVLEERRAVVEDEVNADELLKGLERDTRERAKAVAVRVAEAVDVAGRAERADVV